MTRTEVLRSFSAIEAVLAEWEELLGKSPGGNIFLSPQWILTWARVYIRENQLAVIVVYDDKKMIAIAPLWIDRKPFFPFRKVRILKFLGDSEVCPDHLDIIIGNKKHIAEATEAIWAQLYGPLRKEWDIFEYHQVPVESPILAALKGIADRDQRCLMNTIRDYTPCPYLPLPDTWEKYLESLSSNQRRALKVSTERLAEQGRLELRFSECLETLSGEMDLLIDLNMKAWADRGGSGSFSSQQARLFHHQLSEQLLKQGSLFLCSLNLGDTPLASFYGFRYKSTVYYYVMGVAKDPTGKASVGRVLLGQCIRKAIELGCSEFDLLRGDERFKYDWTDLERRELSIDFYNRKPITFAFILSGFTKFYLKQIAKALLSSRLDKAKKVLKSESNVEQS